MDSLDEGTWPCPFPVTGNGHGRVTEPEMSNFVADIWARSLSILVLAATLVMLGVPNAAGSDVWRIIPIYLP